MVTGDAVVDLEPSTALPEFTPRARRALAASVVAMLFGGAMNIGLFPLIMMPMSRSLGWNRAEIGSMGGLFFVSAATGYPAWGYLADRFGARKVLLAATPLVSLGFVAQAALTSSFLTSYAIFAMSGFMSALTVVHLKGHAVRFDRHRGLVLAVLGMTIGVSVGITPFFGKFVLDAYGWRALYVVFGMLPLCVAMPILFAWFSEQAVPSLEATPRIGQTGITFGSAVRTRTFWLIIVMVICSGFVFAGMQSHFVAFLQERGLSNQGAVVVLSVAVFGGLACQMLTGWLLDRWRSPRAALPFIAIALSGMLLLQAAYTPMLTTIGAIILQSGVGGELSMVPYLISRSFGTAHMARIYGTIAFTGQVLGGAAPVLMGRVHDQTQSYAGSLPIFAVLLALALVLAYLLGKSFRFDGMRATVLQD